MREISVKVAAGNEDYFSCFGDYIRLKSAAVDIKIETDRGEFATLEEGDELSLNTFERLRLSHASGVEQTVTLMIGRGTRSASAKVGGSVALSGQAVAATQTTKTVTNASAQLLAANPERRFILIQNNSSTGIIYLNLAGAAATVADGIKIDVGGLLLLDSALVSGKINAIGSIASNPNVIVVEG